MPSLTLALGRLNSHLYSEHARLLLSVATVGYICYKLIKLLAVSQIAFEMENL